MMVRGLLFFLVFSAASEPHVYANEHHKDSQQLQPRQAHASCKALSGECVRTRKPCPNRLPMEMPKIPNFCRRKYQRCCYPDLTGCTQAGGAIFSYVGVSYCALQNRTSWNETRSLCEDIGMVIAQPQDPIGLASYMQFMGVPCSWFWLGGRGNNYNQVWLNGSVIYNDNSLWYDVSPMVSSEFCMDLNVCNGQETPLQTYPCEGAEFVLCQGGSIPTRIMKPKHINNKKRETENEQPKQHKQYQQQKHQEKQH